MSVSRTGRSGGGVRSIWWTQMESGSSDVMGKWTRKTKEKTGDVRSEVFVGLPSKSLNLV